MSIPATHKAYCNILNKELLTALGCTEPIAIAYAGAKARQVLGQAPETIEVFGSGNVIKNTKSVVVPNTNGQKGIDTAVAAGVLFGNADKRLEVLCDVTEEQKPQIAEFVKSGKISVKPAKNDKVFYISVTAKYQDQSATVVIEDAHTNVTEIYKNGVQQFKQDNHLNNNNDDPDYKLLSVKDIVEFANNGDLNILIHEMIYKCTAFLCRTQKN